MLSQEVAMDQAIYGGNYIVSGKKYMYMKL